MFRPSGKEALESVWLSVARTTEFRELWGGASSGSWYSTGYLVQLGYQNSVRLWKLENRSPQLLAEQSSSAEVRQWHQVQVEVKGAPIDVWVDNQLVLSEVDTNPILGPGRVGLVNCSGYVYFDNLLIETL